GTGRRVRGGYAFVWGPRKWFYLQLVRRRSRRNARPLPMLRMGTMERPIGQSFTVFKGGTMSEVLKEVLTANKEYAASFGEKAGLAMPPARRFAILTCMDARLDPAKYAGLREGDAHVIRNAGGRAGDDAIRSLVISYKLLGTREWFVI